MRTWGYIVNASLAKLDLDSSDAVTQDLTSRFHIFANEAMTQIVSSIKPKETTLTFEISDEDVGKVYHCTEYSENFIAFGRDVNLWHSCDNARLNFEVYDTDVLFRGYDEIVFLHKGTFYISVIENWYTFSETTDSQTDVPLPIPDDICDCLPSYIASQCYKVDDEVKSAIYRNEYEMFLARINTDSKINTKSFIVGGDW